MPIDPDTYDRYQYAANKSRKHGLSLPESLDRAELLLTQKRLHEIQVHIAEGMWRRVDRQSANKLMAYYYDRESGTAAEMLEAIKQWFALVVQKLADGTLEEL